MCVWLMLVNMSCTYSIFASISSFDTLPLCLFHVSVGHLEWWWCLVCLQLLNLHHCFIYDMGWIVVGLSLPPAPQSLGVVYMCVMFVNMSCTYSIFASISSCFHFAILSLSHVSVGHLEWWWCLVCLQLLNLYHCFIFGIHICT